MGLLRIERTFQHPMVTRRDQMWATPCCQDARYHLRFELIPVFPCGKLSETTKKISFIRTKTLHIKRKNAVRETHFLVKYLSPHEFTTVVGSAADKRDRTALCLLVKRDRKPLNCVAEAFAWATISTYS